MFAPADRSEPGELKQDSERVARAGLVDHVTHVIPSPVLILNGWRQVVYANDSVKRMLGAASDDEVLGRRPGELLNCIHACERAAGCGTSEFCSQCGAVRAILNAQSRQVGTAQECRITTTSGAAYEFMAWASPFGFDGHRYVIFTLADIRHQKRREVLEETFFHDVNNMLTSIVGHAEMLGEASNPEETSRLASSIEVAGRELAAQVGAQRNLLAAEDGRLGLELESGVSGLDMLAELTDAARRWWPDTAVVQRQSCGDFSFTTDRSLLHRVLFNMVKNAVEASQPGDVVLVGCSPRTGLGIFTVHNRGFMPRCVQLQVFQRSFSTKGRGRGVGTYSMKLFGEKYLKGRVWFTTSEEHGTTFFLSVPLRASETFSASTCRPAGQ